MTTVMYLDAFLPRSYRVIDWLLLKLIQQRVVQPFVRCRLRLYQLLQKIHARVVKLVLLVLSERRVKHIGRPHLRREIFRIHNWRTAVVILRTALQRT